jgi:catechol 2,3-dioxygenase-like lactoylglutathione lyase family enzyme
MSIDTAPTITGRATTPGLLGVSHLGITVTDTAAAQGFWTSVMGFVTVFEGEDYCMLIEPSAMLAIGFTTHERSADGPFDEHHVGLDHLALAVADADALRQWEQRLLELGVPHSAISTSEWGHHLNLRAPDDFPIELFVLTPEGAAAMGLTLDSPPAAGTHHIAPPA